MMDMKKLLMLALAWLFTTLALAQAPSGTLAVVRPDGTTTVLTATALSALPRESVTASVHDKPAVFAGSDLREVLRAAGVEPPDRLRGSMLRRVIVVRAADGYAVVFAFAELDLSLGDRQVYVVDRVEGQPLAADDGPWRLVVPRDARGARWVRQVTRISVVDLP